MNTSLAVGVEASKNPHVLWIQEHGSLEGCCGCDCHCAPCGGACAPCAEEEPLADEAAMVSEAKAVEQDAFALWIQEHGSLEGCCGCDCHCAPCGGPCGPCLEEEAEVAAALAAPVTTAGNASVNPHTQWIEEHGSLEGCCGCDCHCAPCGGSCEPCADDEALEKTSSDILAVEPEDAFALWIAEHGSLEGCCGCDCHCADCGGPCGPCADEEDVAPSAVTQEVPSANITANPHTLWIQEHGSLEGCCGCDCHCAPCGGACAPCAIVV